MTKRNFIKTFHGASEMLMREDFPSALKLLKELTKTAPESAEVWVKYGSACANMGQLANAAEAWICAGKTGPKAHSFWLDLGHLFESIGQYNIAKEYFIKAETIDPTSINPQISQAVLLEKQNRITDARIQVDKCLRRDPKDEQSRYLVALLDLREKNLEKAECGFRDIIGSNPKHPYVTYASHYGLAQVLDRKGYYDEAMQHLFRAKEHVQKIANIQLIHKSYDNLASKYVNLANSLSPQILNDWRKILTKKDSMVPIPAFLGGHPRSGTTLLEQIIGSHPSVNAYDETSVFRGMLMDSKPLLNELSENQILKIRGDYFDTLRGQFKGNSDAIVYLDKNPSFTIFLPMWLKLFPELRVIVALRDPRDVIISCFFQNIPLNSVNANFLSLERLAKHYSDLMSVWIAVREWQGLNWIETRYESTVSDLNSEGCRVTKFLTLDWHERQEHFYTHARKTHINAPTYHDVTHPIYSRSVARWHHYRKYLEPIGPTIKRFLEAFGYKT